MTPRRSVLLLSFAVLLIALGTGLALFSRDAAEPWGVPGECQPEVDRDPTPVAGTIEPERDVTVEVRPTARLLAALPVPVPRIDAREPEAGTYRWVAGAAAVAAVVSVGGGAHLLRMADTGGAPTYRIVRRLDDAAIDRPVAGAAFRGRVVDPQGAPIEGATIWLGGARATTDADGRFALGDVAGGDGVPLAIGAPGFAASVRTVAVRRDTASDAADYVLEPHAVIEVQLAARMPPGEPPRAFVVPASAAVDSRLLSFPFFLQGPDAPERCGVPLDAQGRCRLEGLPRDSSLRVVVRHPLLSAPAVAVRLREGVEPVVVPGRLLPAVRGRVTAVEGAPLAEVTVLSRPLSGSGGMPPRGPWLLPAEAYFGDAVSAATTAAGEFVVGRHEDRAATCLLEFRGAGRLGLQVTVSGKAPQRTFAMPDAIDLAGRPELRLSAPRPARLRVRQGNRTLTPFFHWSGHPFSVPWRNPYLVDVEIRVVPPGGVARLQVHRGLVVGGAVDLVIDLDG